VKKPEQALWDYVSRVMHGHWQHATRVENKAAPNHPDVAYSCNGQTGHIELKVVDHWPVAKDAPLTIPKLTNGQRDWLKQHGGRSFVLARIGAGGAQHSYDYLLIRHDQIDNIGAWNKLMWCWYGYGFWRGRIDPQALAFRLSS
jgi:hypothetical protein